MDSLMKRYAPSLLPLLVMVGGVFTAAGDASAASLTDWRTLAQIGVLLATTGATYVLGLLPVGWRGAWKVGAPILGAVLSFLIATIGTDWHPSRTNVILVIVGVVKIIATQLGVAIRLDPVKAVAVPAAGVDPTSPAPTAVVGAGDAVVDGDGLADPNAPKRIPEHRADA
jgi:hypothetical protein